MIVRHLDELLGTEREVRAPTWTSRRLLLAQDGVGYSLHDTIINAQTETLIHYQHHLESVYCIEGLGELIPDGGSPIKLAPDTLYVLNGHERHLLRARTRLRMICVFTPALTGHEVHDQNGVYPPPAPSGESA